MEQPNAQKSNKEYLTHSSVSQTLSFCFDRRSFSGIIWNDNSKLKKALQSRPALTREARPQLSNPHIVICRELVTQWPGTTALKNAYGRRLPLAPEQRHRVLWNEGLSAAHVYSCQLPTVSPVSQGLAAGLGLPGGFEKGEVGKCLQLQCSVQTCKNWFKASLQKWSKGPCCPTVGFLQASGRGEP